ncbi:TPA: hypothetical protein QHZ98_005446 [Klebsiella oxytoca]|nr:hypothetical protein [Klebsiella oxytoca]HDS6520365.1 hypothetical protein [Klebsiella oxytoca]
MDPSLRRAHARLQHRQYGSPTLLLFISRLHLQHSRFFKSKACCPYDFKATEQWVSQQSHMLPDCDWQHITFTMPHLLWRFF